jgi:putative hydrolase of the HAD superfamily
MTPIKAIFFDAAGTLLRAHPSVGHVYAEVVGQHGTEADPAALDAAFRKAFATRRGASQPALHNEGYDWWKALVREVFGSLRVEVPDFDRCFHDLYWRFARDDVWRLYPDALPALLEARGRGWKIALVSNWDVRLRRVIEGMGIASLFDALIISTEVGAEKPDPRIFRIACNRLTVPPGEACHVGDSETEDVAGASAAGVRAILLDRRSAETGNGHVIRSLGELCAHADSPQRDWSRQGTVVHSPASQ